MKKEIRVNGKEIKVETYEPTAEFLKINTIPEDEIDLGDLWTDGDDIYYWDDGANEYLRLWTYC